MMYCVNEQAHRPLSPLISACIYPVLWPCAGSNEIPRRLHNYCVDRWLNHYDVLITAPNDRSRPIDLGIVRVITSLVDLHGPVCELRSQCILIQY